MIASWDESSPSRAFIKQPIEPLISQRQRGLYQPEDFYRPLELIIQRTDFCSAGTCPGCAISSVPARRQSRSIPVTETIDLLTQAADLGFLAYVCSFSAEPFDDLDLLGKVLQRFRGRLEPSKLNTSCIHFSSVDRAVQLLKRLKDVGWSDTAVLVPVLSLSVGMQQHKVPLERVVYGIQAFHQVFAPGEAVLTISHYHTQLLYRDFPQKLLKLYRQLAGCPFTGVLNLKSRPLEQVGTAVHLEAEHFEFKPLREWVRDYNCFRQKWGEYLDPSLRISPVGLMSPCYAYALHPGLVVGSIRNGDGLAEAIRRTNSSRFLQTVGQGGTQAVLGEVSKIVPDIGDALVSSRHQACAALFAAIQSSPTLLSVFQADE